MTTLPRTDTDSDLIRTLIRAVDDSDQDTIAALTTTDVHFRFGNAAPTGTRSELLAAEKSFRDTIADLRHTILNLWEVGDGTVVALMDVYYRRLDGRELNLPCCNVFGVRDGVVNDYRIYMDVNPVIEP
jgi:ketosteroid isomerase-like protein